MAHFRPTLLGGGGRGGMLSRTPPPHTRKGRSEFVLGSLGFRTQQHQRHCKLGPMLMGGSEIGARWVGKAKGGTRARGTCLGRVCVCVACHMGAARYLSTGGRKTRRLHPFSWRERAQGERNAHPTKYYQGNRKGVAQYFALGVVVPCGTPPPTTTARQKGHGMQQRMGAQEASRSRGGGTWYGLACACYRCFSFSFRSIL